MDWEAFADSLSHAKYEYLPIVLALGSLTSWVRALRWRVLLTSEQNISARNVFWANMAGYLGNNILPARAGELIRAAYVSKENEIPSSFALATGLVERFMDLIALVILGSLSISLTGILSKPLQDALKLMAGIAIAGSIVLVVLPYFGNTFQHIVARLPILGTTVKEKLAGLLEQFLRGVAALHHPARAFMFILFTSLIWFMDGIGTIILAHALDLQFTFPEAFLLLAGLGLSSAIPSTPGYVGVYQFVAVIVLQPFGISNASALAFIILFQILNLLLIAFWGGIAILRSPYKSQKE